jgi:hypothetical protein
MRSITGVVDTNEAYITDITDIKEVGNKFWFITGRYHGHL